MSDVDYKRRCEELEGIIGLGSNDIARKAFLSVCKVVSSQTTLLNKFNIGTEITKIPAKDGDKIYERTMAILEAMPKMITNIMEMREKLKISNKEIEESFVDSIAQSRN